MGIIQEFKEFAMKGNVVDLAVGVIIGAAFGKIVTSMVEDVLMPPIGMALGKVDFKDLKIPLKAAVPATDTTPAVAAVEMRIGLFANNLINFLIVAFCIFLVVKAMNTMMRKNAAPAK